MNVFNWNIKQLKVVLNVTIVWQFTKAFYQYGPVLILVYTLHYKWTWGGWIGVGLGVGVALQDLWTGLCVLLFVCIRLVIFVEDNGITGTSPFLYDIWAVWKISANNQTKESTLHQIVLPIVWMLFSPSKQSPLNPSTWWPWLTPSQLE